MSDEFKVEIVKPDKSFYSNESVREVVVPAFEGDMGILKADVNLVEYLDPGVIDTKYKLRLKEVCPYEALLSSEERICHHMFIRHLIWDAE